MEIGKNKVVSIDYTLTDNDGRVIDSSEGREPLSYLHGAGNIIPGLEKALEGKNSGEQVQVTVEPGEGYGERSDELMQAVPRNLFDAENVEVGMQFQAQTQGGPQVVTVVEVNDEQVTVDANHPLAGETLNFDVTVTDVRDASDEEVEHGHVH